MSVRRGLPTAVKMRHDLHYVDSLVFKEGEVVGRMIPIDQVSANPDQPRRDLGDLEGLAQSIREHGILEPILVSKEKQGYQIISGERRYRAAVQVGLTEIPCILKDLTDQQILEIALVENLQRKDLHPFEEADGLKTLFDKYQYTHEQIGDKIGKSRSSVTETLTISKIEPEVRDLIFEAQISAKSLLLAIAKCEGLEAQRAMIEKIRKGAGRDAVRQDRKKQQKPKPFVFQFKDPQKTFRFDMKFKRAQVSKTEVLDALQRIMEEIQADDTWS